ncbi:hypothetical protein [Nocardiopsis sp. YSL2]|uniref:hypothetical protein n=1 Tax=Nocardiopsis sp. YSL2 TaxID=2939492 RepID=UPI0026F47A1A|nr:hypothetical protein [Nocardiopsis sp. YSL2]
MSIRAALARVGRALIHVRDPRGTRITRRRLEAAGDRWPLTVPSGYVVHDRGAIYFRRWLRTYALNGLARGHHRDITPIWREDPDIVAAMRDAGATGTIPKVPLTPLLNTGRPTP